MVTASVAIDMEYIGGKMVEIVNLLILLGLGGKWSVERPF